MNLWLLVMAVAVGLAAVIEAINQLGPERFIAASQEARLKETIAKTQADVAESVRQMDVAKTALRAAFADTDKVKSELIQLDRDLTQRKRVPPILIYRIGEVLHAQTCFRAPVSKVLSTDADPEQEAIWKTPAFVETWADTPYQASRQAQHQFRPERGYAVGAFKPQGGSG